VVINFDATTLMQLPLSPCKPVS